MCDFSFTAVAEMGLLVVGGLSRCCIKLVMVSVSITCSEGVTNQKNLNFLCINTFHGGVLKVLQS